VKNPQLLAGEGVRMRIFFDGNKLDLIKKKGVEGKKKDR